MRIRLPRAVTRRWSRAALGAILGAIVVAAGITAAQPEIDLTTLDAQATVNGAVLRQSNFSGSTGTGVFIAFVRVQATGTEEGYNTSGRPVQYDENTSSQFTRDLPLNQVPTVGIDGTMYREFRLDINQVNSGDSRFLSLDRVRLFVSTQPGINVADPNANDFGHPGTTSLVWDLDGDPVLGDVHVKLDYDLAPGSGNGDLALYVPESYFGAAGAACPYTGVSAPDCGQYLYLYSHMGSVYESNDGFEEWATRQASILAVSKTAVATFDRTFDWTITKTATPTTWNLFTGDTGTTAYSVTATKGAGVDSGWAVSGTITVHNPSNQNVSVTSVTDEISGIGAVAVSCPVTFPYTLSGGATIQCTYSTPLPDGASRTNLAVANTSDGGAFAGSADITFGTPTSVVNDTVTVTDSMAGTLGNINSTQTFNYNRPYTCNADQGTQNNVATITQTGQTANASVTVNCYAPTVTKTADTTYTRTWLWDIDKTATPATWNLFRGDSGTTAYAVTATKTGFVDSDWAVNGTITVNNPAPMAATINSVSDAVSGVGAATVDCGATVFPYSLPAGGNLVCTYSLALPNADSRTNTATATLQNYSYNSAGVGTPAGTTDFTGNAAVVFGAPTTVINDSVNVTDTYAGNLGTIDATTTFNYNRTFTCDADEGTHPNTATITETGQNDSASVTVNCYALATSKDANTTYTRTWLWDIDKTATPATWNLFRGDSGTTAYAVTVTKTGFVDSDWAVNGTITVNNPAPMAATINSLADVVSGAGAGAAAVDCGATVFPYSLPAGGNLVCTYSLALPNADTRTNTATATLQNYSYNSAGVPTATGTTDFSGSAAVVFGDPTTVVNFSVNVTDTYAGNLGTISATTTFNYNRTFTCDADEGTHPNTATITETGQNDSASVTVNCYALTVTKDANTTFDRTWTWDIDKTSDDVELILAQGQTYTVDYEVTVDVMAVTDSNWAVNGTINIANPAPMAATLTGVADVVSPAIAASVNCPTLTVPASGSVNCTYSADLPNADTRTNTATATLQNYSYNSAGVPTPAGTTDFSGNATVDFGAATITEIDKCVDVTDSYAGNLGTVCADAAPVTFNYTRDIVAGDFLCDTPTNVENTAAFTTNTTQTQGSDDHTIVVTVECDQGCTLTQGYWKTHSEFGPAPYDPTWAMLPSGASTPFYLSGQTWHEVFWTAPKGGNVYYQLAHQYMAAKLSQMAGAGSTPEVDAAIAYAEVFFATYTPTSNFSKALQSQVRNAASTLDDYNNGLIGPGHCSE